MMLTYHDAITAEENLPVDADTNFYLVSCRDKYSLRAISCNTQQLTRCPETSEWEYWPVKNDFFRATMLLDAKSREVFFPKGHLTKSPLSKAEVKKYLGFDPEHTAKVPFNEELARRHAVLQRQQADQEALARELAQNRDEGMPSQEDIERLIMRSQNRQISPVAFLFEPIRPRLEIFRPRLRNRWSSDSDSMISDTMLLDIMGSLQNHQNENQFRPELFFPQLGFYMLYLVACADVLAARLLVRFTPAISFASPIESQAEQIALIYLSLACQCELLLQQQARVLAASGFFGAHSRNNRFQRRDDDPGSDNGDINRPQQSPP